MQHEVDAQSMSDMTVLRELSTYLFPKDNPEFRWRIGTAMSLLVVSKLLNVGVRIFNLINSPFFLPPTLRDSSSKSTPLESRCWCWQGID